MKKTLVKSILLAIFGMMVVQNVNAQKISAGEEVATNIGPGLGVGDYFYYDNILYQVATVASSGNYEAKAVSFYGESLPAEIEILGGGQANSCTFTVTEIEALNSVKTMSGTSYVAGDASALDAITTLIFVKEDGFGGFAGTIKAGSFANLSSLAYIYTELETPPAAESGSFAANIKNNVRLTVPVAEYGTIAGKYAKDAGWGEIKTIYTEGDNFAFGDVDCNNTFNSGDTSLLAIFAKVRKNNEASFDQTINLHSIDIDGNGVKNSADASALSIMIKNRARKK